MLSFAVYAVTEAIQGRFVGAAVWSGTMSGDQPDLFTADGDDVAYVGTRQVWGNRQWFGLSSADRRQHVYVVGASGTGKTTLLKNLILQDIEHGMGVGVIDPHGDLAFELLDAIPPERTDHVVYFNPADLEHPIGLNLLTRVPQHRRHRITSGVVGAMKSIWRDSWGPRMEYILSASVAALLDCDNTSILGIQRMLVDARYRRWVVRQVKDPAARAFWEREFERYRPDFMQEAIAPIQNKVGQLVMSPPLRHVLGQVRRKIDPRFMMDRGRILIANLSKGLLGDDKANLLGSLLVASFELAALARADLPESKRRDFRLYIDEFHNFTTDSFATLLSEARKYRLSLTLSHQYLDQLTENVRHAVFGNTGTLVSFRVGGRDAGRLATEYGLDGQAARFSSLANFEALVRPSPQDVVGEPFVIQTLAPLDIRGGRRDTVIRRSREQYASKRNIVEGKIGRFFWEGNISHLPWPHSLACHKRLWVNRFGRGCLPSRLHHLISKYLHWQAILYTFVCACGSKTTPFLGISQWDGVSKSRRLLANSGHSPATTACLLIQRLGTRANPPAQTRPKLNIFLN